MNNPMMLHCGGKEVSLDRLNNLYTPPPVGAHYPIPHIAFYDEVNRALDATGLTRVNEVHAINDHGDIEGSNYFGMAEMRIPESDEYGFMIGWRSSHTKCYAASLVLGSRIFVCDNLAFSGEVKLQRKHTRYIMRDLPNVVARATSQVVDQRTTQENRFSAYKGRVLTRAESDHAVIDMIRAKAINSSDVLKVVNEFDKPTHEEHLNADGEQTVWTLFNSVTEVATKGSNIFVLPKKTQALHAVCDGVAGVGNIIDMVAA
jgi:hypothetical protein